MLTQEQITEIQHHPISWSRLKHYEKSPAHFLEAWLNPPEETPAMTLGRALHCLALEPDKFSSRYVAAPEGIDKRTKEGKALWQIFESEAKGKTILTAEQMKQAQGMAQAIAASVAGKALDACPNREQTIEWTDPVTDLHCKGVLDAWGDRWIIDIKTTDDASDRAFARTVANYQYHGQGAFYLDGLALTSPPTGPRYFLLVAVEKSPPHGVRVYMCSADMIVTGRQLYLKLLGRHAECVERGEWPGYPDEVESLELPAWAA